MEISCNRCNQSIQAENCYCPVCGLPQLVYSADVPTGLPQPERWGEAVRDASSVDWKPALIASLKLAIPAGLLSSAISPTGSFGLIWMATAAGLAVMLYIRGQQPAWITLGAGARIGLITGLVGAWVAFGAGGLQLFVQRFFLHQSSQIDAEYSNIFITAFQQRTQQSIAGMGSADAAQAQAIFSAMQARMLSPEGHAGMWAGSIAVSSLFLLPFAVAGGALAARMQARKRQPEL
ncbi:MAG: hypothetical protein ABR907_10550 [Terracidiphilus sp.]|jgi:hypothetical protein